MVGLIPLCTTCLYYVNIKVYQYEYNNAMRINKHYIATRSTRLIIATRRKLDIQLVPDEKLCGIKVIASIITSKELLHGLSISANP